MKLTAGTMVTLDLAPRDVNCFVALYLIVPFRFIYTYDMKFEEKTSFVIDCVVSPVNVCTYFLLYVM